MKKNKNISGFKTPENYFENFEIQLFSKIEEENLPKSAGFQVPENYFDNLEQRILNTVTASEKPKKVISLFPKKYFGYAAAIAACLIIGFTIFDSSQDKSTSKSIQLGLIDNYIEEGNLNMDLYDLTSYLEFQDISIINFENQNFPQTTLESYLLENTEEGMLSGE